MEQDRQTGELSLDQNAMTQSNSVVEEISENVGSGNSHHHRHHHHENKEDGSSGSHRHHHHHHGDGSHRHHHHRHHSHSGVRVSGSDPKTLTWKEGLFLVLAVVAIFGMIVLCTQHS